MPSISIATPTPTTQALYRRPSGFIISTPSLVKLKRTRSLGRALDIQRTIGPRLPTEVLDRIVDLILESSHSFSLIAAFSLASSDLRQIAFRRFFWSLEISSRGHLDSLSRILGTLDRSRRHGEENGFFWVRNILIHSTTLASTFTCLSRFSNLHSLSIDFSRDGLATQHFCMKCIFNQNLLTKNASFRLGSLKLTSLTRIDVPLLKIIANCFPHLDTLFLSCTERLHLDCCWVCLEESASTIIHSPIPDMFTDSETLATSFAEALKPLTKLIHLHLGIYLSSEKYLISHFDHEDLDAGLYGPEHCNICKCDDFAAAVRTQEHEAAVILAKELGRLTSVGWSSFFGFNRHGCKIEAGDIGRTTTVYISRQSGKIKARSQPW